MAGEDWGYLSYLALLLVVVGSALIGRDRLKLGAAIRMALIWVLIIGAVALAYSMLTR